LGRRKVIKGSIVDLKAYASAAVGEMLETPRFILHEDMYGIYIYQYKCINRPLTRPLSKTQTKDNTSATQIKPHEWLEHMDLETWFESCPADTLKSNFCCVVPEGGSVMVPFGHVALIVALPPNYAELGKTSKKEGDPEKEGRGAAA
jgi:hypothetical protein